MEKRLLCSHNHFVGWQLTACSIASAILLFTKLSSLKLQILQPSHQAWNNACRGSWLLYWLNDILLEALRLIKIYMHSNRKWGKRQ